MGEKVLFVDDEQNVLDAIKRQLRKKINIEVALGPEEGLSSVQNRGPYAVVVSDLRMPIMDGIQFLSHVRKLAPNTVRMMLTGHADLENTIKSVNEGNIFQFLTKPCAPELLLKALSVGIRQYRLVMAERVLLEKTLKGSIKVLSELLTLLNPEAFGRSSRVKGYVKEITSHLGITDAWEIETAAMLCQIGCIILPQETIIKLYQGKQLTDEETQLYHMHPMIASDLLGKIPRMEKIAKIIAYQEKHFDGSGIPGDSCQGSDISLGSRILKVALDFDTLEANEMSKENVLAKLKNRTGWYDPDILGALEKVIQTKKKYVIKNVSAKELNVGMIVGDDIVSEMGQLLLTKGQAISRPAVQLLKNFAQNSGIKEPIKVFIPVLLDDAKVEQ